LLLWIGDNIIWVGSVGYTFEELAKSLEATILYKDSQHNIPGLQGRANKHHILYIVMDETTKFVSHVTAIAHCVDKRS
jgi:hypothetical protein